MNQIVDFELRGLGTHMARRRSQVGWIERLGKSWVGYAYKYERLDDGTEKRRVKQHVIGRCAEMDKATAMAQHQKWVAALLSPETAVVPPAPHTFQQAWEKYAALKENSGAWGKHHASTMRAAMNWVLPDLGSRPVALLRVDDLMRPLLAMAAAGKNTHYLHHATQAIRNTMDFAEENQWIQSNPTHSKFFRKPKSIIQQVHAIEQRELGDVLIAELRKSENLKLLVAVAVSGIAGARRQELWVLRWNDIAETSIRLDEAWKRYEPPERRIGPTKTGKPRHVPIGPGVHQVLMRWKATLRPADESEFIFPSESRHGWPENLDNFLRRHLKPFAAGIGMPHLTFRLLRKTAASLFGNDLLSAQAHLGHARPDTTAINYMAAPRVEHLARVAALDKALLGTRRKKPATKAARAG